VTTAQVVATIVFGVTFVMVLSDRVDRTIVAMAGAAVMVGVGLFMGFYSQEQALYAIDFNTLGLLLGIMIIAMLLQRTGFFEYVAILAGKLSRGNPWLLVVMLGTVTTLLSTVLPNVTIIVLTEPVSVEDDCALIRALSFMEKNRIRDLPVVKEGKLVGITSRVDIGRAFLSTWLTAQDE